MNDFCVFSSTDGNQAWTFRWQVNFVRAIYGQDLEVILLVPPHYFKDPNNEEALKACFTDNIKVVPVSKQHHEVCVALGKTYCGPPPMFYWFFADKYLEKDGFYIDCGDVFILSKDCFNSFKGACAFESEIYHESVGLVQVPTTGVVRCNLSLIPPNIETLLQELLDNPRKFLNVFGDEWVLYNLSYIPSIWHGVHPLPGQIHMKMRSSIEPLLSLVKEANSE